MSDEGERDEPKVKADHDSLAIGSISVGGEVSGNINVAGGHTIHAAEGATVIVGASTEAVNSLATLRTLMQKSSVVQQAVVEFQADFKIAHEQVEQLGDYKDLHDLLHRMQFNCFNGIVHAAARFPNDDLSLDELNDHCLTLEDIVGELIQVSSRPTMSRQDLKWIEEISSILVELHKAIDTLDERVLKKVIWDMNRLLAIQPARINTLLNHAAHNLRLPALKDALIRIYDHLKILELEPGDGESFKTGIDAFGTLDQALNIQVESHDNWQSLDIELRQMDATFDLQPSSLEMYWPVIKSKADLLYVPPDEEWAIAIKRDSDNLDEAFTSNNPPMVRRAFRSYQRRVNNHFYLVDKELKNLCGNLRQIGVPLDSVLRMIQ